MKKALFTPRSLKLVAPRAGSNCKFIAGLAPWRSNDDALDCIGLDAAAWDIVWCEPSSACGEDEVNYILMARAAISLILSLRIILQQN